MIISILNLKGGAGKTTFATNLAAKFAADGQKTLLLDTDRQRSSVLWYELREKADKNLFINSLTEPLTLTKELLKLDDIYPIVLVDGAPNMEATTAIIAKVSNLVVIPMQPSGFDLGATKTFLASLQDTQIMFPDMKILIVFNRINMRTSLARDLIDGVKMLRESPELKDLKFSIAETKIQNRVVYADAASTGESVFERRDKKAQEEMQSLMDEIKSILNEEA